MRINVYKEELTDRVEIVSKTVDGIEYRGLRIYLYMPVSKRSASGELIQLQGPFLHREGDDDSSAITIWSDSAGLNKIVDAACKALHEG
jgi:hypothetical protein